MYSIHCCTLCGWVMVSTVALATLTKRFLYLRCQFTFTTLNQYGSHYACMYVQIKDPMNFRGRQICTIFADFIFVDEEVSIFYIVYIHYISIIIQLKGSNSVY